MTKNEREMSEERRPVINKGKGGWLNTNSTWSDVEAVYKAEIRGD